MTYPRRFKSDNMQKMYVACRENAAKGLFSVDGRQWRGAAHRNAYWNGFNGVKPLAIIPNTLAWASYVAGRDDAKAKN